MTPPKESLGRAYVVDRPPATVVTEPRDRMQVALDRHLGVKPERVARVLESDFFSAQTQVRLTVKHQRELGLHRDMSLRPADSLMEIFNECKAGAVSGTGRVSEAQASADFANLLGNTMGRLLLTGFMEPDYGERSLFLPARATSLRDQRVVGLDEVADIPTADPEVADYTELPKLAERAASFAMIQKGVLCSITRKVVVNDDVGAVQRLVVGLGRAARRTSARAVYAPWVANSNAPDGVAWFAAGHNNLQTAALAKAEALAAVLKLLNQTQPGNSEKMGARARPGSLWLMVPPALWDVAYALNQETGSALFHLFGVSNEYVIINPLLTDTNDWGVHRDAREVESVRVSFLGGREEPEFFLADTPNSDQLFIGDRIIYKLRHEFGTAVAEHRAAAKAVVA